MIKRKEYIDIAKGVGVLLVILGHSVTSDNIIVSWQCSFFMPLFFLCSGLCYNNPKRVAEKAKTILIPYYMWGGAGLFIELGLLILKKEFSVFIVLKRVVYLLLGMSTWNYPLWFLAAFFVCKCIFDWFIKVFETKYQSRIPQIIFTFGCFLIGIVLAHIKKQYVFFYPFRFDIGLTMIPFMMVGYKMKIKMDILNHSSKYMKSIFCAVFLIINLLAHHYNTLVSVNSSDYGNPILFLISSISGSLLIIVLSQLLSELMFVNRGLSWFGKNSMLIMCSHAIILVFIAKGLLTINLFIGASSSIVDYEKFVCCAGSMFPLCVFLNKSKNKVKKVTTQVKYIV